MFQELNELFESTTIKPTFEKVHVILALLVFGENREGLGRYRLQKELLIGSGTARSLIKKLKENIGFITVPDEISKSKSEIQRKGHILTEKGLKYLNKIKSHIPFLKEGDLKILKEIIIETEDVNSYVCQVKNSGNKITNGIAQRDAVIKVDGIGATCLIYNGDSLVFPSGSLSDANNSHSRISKTIQNYIENLQNKNTAEKIFFEKNDVIIIGLGDNPEKARLAALNAALTLI
ncbi:MAG: DUF4443 domain-containing protein [Candidatus Hermodarchaeota archaeon]